jgi:tetratricopeptide (TPR) repeat protein
MTAIHQLESLLANRYLLLAIEHARKGRWEQAELELDRVGSLLPADPVVPMTRARIRYHQGRRQDALNEIAEAERLGGPMSEIGIMRDEILESDRRKLRRMEERVSNRQMRREHYSSLVDRLEEAVFSLSSRELVYLMLGTTFLLAVLWWDLSAAGGVG